MHKQGDGAYIKRIGDSVWCLNSKATDEHPMEEFVENHQVAGFCNTKSIAYLCNAEFVTEDEQVFLVATRNIRRGEEIFAFYRDRKAQAILERGRKAARKAAAAKRRASSIDGECKPKAARRA